MLRKSIILFISFFIPIILFAEESKKVSVQLLWKHQFEFAGFYMAKEKGFYKDVGLDVSFKEYEFGMDISKEVSEQKSDFGVGSSSLILDKINGLDVYLLMPILQSSPLVLMTKKDTNIKNVSDLKDKKIMLTQNQIAMASLNAMFKVNNLKNFDYIAQEHSFKIEDLMDGKTDAMSVYSSNEPFYLIEKRINYTIFDPRDYGFSFYEDIIYTSNKLNQKNPELVKKFYEATKKGWDYAYLNIDETAKVIQKNYNTQHKSLEHLIFEGNELKKMAHFDSNEYGKFKPEVIGQIIQTYNLLNISKATVNINDLIYPDAMYKESSINFVLIIKILIVVLILLIGLYLWNRKLSNLNKKIKESQKKISILLNNAGQGFLIFKEDFKIDNEYSKECEKILGGNIAFKDIRELLFSDENKREFFKTTLLNASYEDMEVKRNSYLSLLPNIIILNKKAIRLEYKIIDNKTFMLILTNVTTQKKLENKIKKEQEIFKMIVAIASESTVFHELIGDYERFISNKIDTSDINELYRIIHTFKGAFSQLYMNDVVKKLHSLETILSDKIKKNNSQGLEEIVDKFDFKNSYIETKKIIGEILGEEFLEQNNYIKIDLSNIKQLQEKIENFLKNETYDSSEYKDILNQIESFSYIKLYPLLRSYKVLVKQLSKRFEKDINFIIDGDKSLVIPHKIKPFIKSLGHVFRNCVDHGIEFSHKRLEKNKDEMGTIICQFRQIDNKLILTITDDGSGIDLDKIRQKALEKKIDIASFSEEDLMYLIFKDNFSTKSKITEISGRGIGMNAVKNELDKIDGNVILTSLIDKGTTMEFIIPLKNL